MTPGTQRGDSTTVCHVAYSFQFVDGFLEQVQNIQYLGNVAGKIFMRKAEPLHADEVILEPKDKQ